MLNKILEMEEFILSELFELNKGNSFSGNEIEKAHKLQKLFVKEGISRTYIDSSGNIRGKLRSELESKNAILISAPLDYNFKVSDEIFLTGKEVIGGGILENSAPLFALLIIAKFLNEKKINKNVYFLGSSCSKTKLTGIKTFLQHCPDKIEKHIIIKGNGLGATSTKAESISKIKITFMNKENSKTVNFFGETNPINAIINFVSRVKDEDVDGNVKMEILQILSGEEGDQRPSSGSISLEIRSKRVAIIDDFVSLLRNIAISVGNELTLSVKFEELIKNIGAESVSSDLENMFLKIYDAFDIKEKIQVTSMELGPSLLKGIDSVVIGIADGGKSYSEQEYFKIKSFYQGIEAVIRVSEKLLGVGDNRDE